MRTHFLNNLEIGGKEKVPGILQNLDLHKLHRLVRLAWESQYDEVCDRLIANLSMTAAYDAKALKEAEITFRFIAVARCKLPELKPSVFLSEVEVEDVASSQLEGIRYIIKTYGSTELEIECRNFEVTECNFVEAGTH